jgi:transcriptional regulator with GAF, ATPase, and Fis domain/tetratricopeptide (TPR) repeat protein
MAPLDQLIGESSAITAVREQVLRLLGPVSRAGRRLPPLLILGETGTGKGLLASAVHRAGGRASAPFVDVNCAAIPETLLEAELFGFERGAFTDARQAKAGLFQAANGGTMFLDEVGLLPLALQSKLLKVIEERAVRRLGSTRTEPLDVSVIAATSEDLDVAVKEGRFRADLYHRLAVVTLVLPPLRARGRDVLVLAEHFLARVCEDYGLPPRVLTDDARAALLAHRWPGNVRELANVLERAALLSDEPKLTAAALALPSAAAGAAAASGLESSPPCAGATGDTETERERRVLAEVLRDTGWNFTRAAARLGLPRNTLRYRAERLGLVPEGPPSRRRGGRPPAAGAAAAPAAPPPGAPAESRRVAALLLRVLPAGPAAPDWEMSRALEQTTGKVRSFGGRIEELGAAEVLATFGLEPDENAPRHAAHAALAVATLAARAQGQGAPAPGVIAALHTDSLPVTREGEGVQLTTAARQAARRALQALLGVARPGTLVASAAACRFLARRFELEPLAPVAGDAAGACVVVRQAEAGRTPFVGRAGELRLLAERFELVQAGQGQVVMVVGEAGIGKSRLLHEFRRRLGRSATWIEGQALSFGRSMPFHPVIDMLRRVLRIGDADPEAVVVAKIDEAVHRLGPGVDETRPFLRYLLSVDPGDPAVLAMDPRRRHAAIVKATHLLLERGAELRPHVVVLEDLHWCDPATEDWITRLVDGIAAKRALVLLTFRPGYRPAFGAGSFHTAIALPTLSGEDSARIAGGVLGVDALPPALQAIVDKAEGNPFFIEELVRSLEEVGAVRRAGDGLAVAASLEGLAVPDTIEEVIRARVERLDGRLQRLLQVASVIGRTVPLPLLQAVTEDGADVVAADLARLQAAEFLHETRVFPEVEHTFKHALTQDVAYGSVEPQQRRALHARIVRAIERLHGDRPGEHVERLAYHALRGELWAEAVRYSRQAGTKAFDRSANREAVASLEQALTALARGGDRPEMLVEAIDIRLALRSALLQLGEIRRITAYLREAEALAAALGDRRRLAWVWTYMTIAALFAGEPAQAQATGERALALAEEVGDVALRATARTPLAHACYERGDHRRAVALFREALDALAGDLQRQRLGQGMPPSLYARSMAAMCLAELGEFPEAIRLGTESAALAETMDLPFGLVLARMALGHAYLVQGRLDDAARALDTALELIAARDIPAWAPWAGALRGHALALAGRPGEAIPVLERAIDRALALPFLFGHSRWVAWLAHARLLAGDVDEARRRGDEAVRLARQRGERGYEACALHTLAEIATVRGADVTPAVALHRQALAIAAEAGMRPLLARIHLALGQLGASVGDPEGRTHLETGRALCAALDLRVAPARAAARGA